MTRNWNIVGITIAFATSLGAQSPPPAAMDALLEHLVGHWIMTGAVRGTPETYSLEATRVLGGRFVELHMTDVHRPPAYEARAFIGVDSAGGRYLAHWLDSFGAAYSIPHATGTAHGDTVWLNFPYPTGAFRDMFAYDRTKDSWYFRLEAADSAGGWRLFGEYQVRQDPSQVLGHWRGRSICVKAEWNAACRDEEVIYDVVRAPADSARVLMHASKIVNGAIVPMGDLELAYVDSAQSWMGEYANGRVHIQWWYKITGNALVGTLLDLPTHHVARHATATKS